MKLKLKNWDKYNKRQKDVKRPFWFAHSNQIFVDPFYVELSLEERQGFLWLLCEASKQNKYGEIDISYKLFEQISGIKRKHLESTISKLLKSGHAAECWPDGGRMATSTRQDKTLQDITLHNKGTIVRNDSESSSPSENDFPLELKELNQTWLDRGVKPSVVAKLLQAYPDPPWIIQKTKELLLWESANPTRKKKNFARFLANCFSRDWDKRKVAAEKKERDWSFLNE